MADEVASLKVVVEAEDRASGTLKKIGSSMSGLETAAEKAKTAGQSVGEGMASAVKGGKTFSNELSTAKGNLEQLTKGLSSQKTATKEYDTALKDASKALDKTRTNFMNAASAYKSNTSTLKDNIAFSKEQINQTDKLISGKKNEIDSLQRANAHLNSQSRAYIDNISRIEELSASITTLERRKANFRTQINDNEKAIKRETKAYKESSAELETAKSNYRNLSQSLAESKKAEEMYTDAIRTAREELARQERIEPWRNLEDSGNKIKSVGESIDTLTKPLQVAGAGAVALGAASAKAAVTFEDNFANVKKTVDGTPEQLDKIKQGIIDLTTVGIEGRKAIPASTEELTALAAAGGQLGIETDNIVKFTETVAMLGSATNLGGEAGAQTLAQFMNVTNTAQKDIGRLGSSIVELGNNFATNEAKIADMALEMGATGSIIGISTQDILAYSTALSSLGVDAQAGGSAVSRIWMDMQSAVSSGGEDLQKFAKISQKSSEEFKQQWQKDASGAFLDFLQGLNKSEDIIRDLSDLGFGNIRDIQALQRLAGESGLPLLKKALEMSAKAWDENNALIDEFNAKSETTASRIQVAKNNIAEAGRSLGKAMLPEVAKGAEYVTALAQSFAAMTDSQKEAVYTGLKWTVGLAAGAKLTATVVKQTGAFVETAGKLGKVFAKGGTLATAGTAALGIGGALAATAGIVVGLNAWGNYMADWSRGGSEMSAEIKGYTDAAKELNDLQYEFKDLSGKISLGKLEGDDLENAKARLEEIKQILAQKYNLDINVSDEKLDGAIEKLKKIQYYSAQQKAPELYDYITDKEDKYKQEKEIMEGQKNVPAHYEKEIEATQNLKGEVLLLKAAYDKGEISLESYKESLIGLMEAAGYNHPENTPIQVIENSILNDSEGLKKHEESLRQSLINSKKNLAESTAKVAEYKQACESLADIGLTEIMFGNAETGLQNIGDAVKYGELSIRDYAAAAALAQNNMSSFTDLQGKSGNVIEKTVSDYQKAAKQFGASGTEIALGSAVIKNGLDSAADIKPEALVSVLKDFDTYAKNFNLSSEQIALGTSLIQQGFDSVKSAGEAGKIEDIFNAFSANGKEMGLSAQQIADCAEKLNLIPEGKMIQITAEGDISLVDSTMEKTEELNGKESKVNVTADTSEAEQGLDNVKQKAESINNTPIRPKLILGDDGSPSFDKFPNFGQNGTGKSESAKHSLFGGTTASAAEIDVPVKAKLKATEVDASKVFGGYGFDGLNPNFLKDGMSTGGTGTAGQSIDITVNANLRAGTISATELMAGIQSAVQATSAIGGMFQSLNMNVNVNLRAGTISATELMAGIQSAIQAAGAIGGMLQSLNLSINVKVTAGNIDTSAVSAVVQSALDGIKELSANSDVNISITAETSGTDEVLKLADTVERLEGKDVDAAANVSGKDEVDALISSINALEGKSVDVTANVSGKDEVDALVASIAAVQSKSVTITANVVTNGSMPLAKGTDNFKGGLATINDERGISDPRELVIHNGRALLFEGRDVTLPLSQGDRVFTARQTQAILRNTPHFANGLRVEKGYRRIDNTLYYESWKDEYFKDIHDFVRAAAENAENIEETNKDNWNSLFRNRYRNYTNMEGEDLPDWKDPTEAIIANTKVQTTLTQKEDERIDLLRDLATGEGAYDTAMDLTNMKISNYDYIREQYEKANLELGSYFDFLNSKTNFNIEDWFDKNGEFTEQYFADYNSLGSQNAQKSVADLASSAKEVYQQMIENADESYKLQIEIFKEQRQLFDYMMQFYNHLKQGEEIERLYAGNIMEKSDPFSGDYIEAVNKTILSYGLEQAWSDAFIQDLEEAGYSNADDYISQYIKDMAANQDNMYSAVEDSLQAQLDVYDNFQNIAEALKGAEIIVDVDELWRQLTGNEYGTNDDYKTQAYLNQAMYYTAQEGYDPRSVKVTGLLVKAMESYTDKVKKQAEELDKLNKETSDNRLKSAENWKKWRDAYDDWEVYDDSPAEYYGRLIEEVQAQYQAELISWEDMREMAADYEIERYRARKDEINDYYNDLLADMDEDWNREDRYKEMNELRDKMDIFRNAVTGQGQRQYEEYQERLKQLEREEEKYQIQLEQKQALEDLKAEYTANEANRAGLLESSLQATEGVKQRVEDIKSQMTAAVSNIQEINNNITNNDNRSVSMNVSGLEIIQELLRKVGYNISLGF